MGVRGPTRDFLTVHSDSRLWSEVELCPGDVVISTPPKSGTTWMQGIVASLVWPDGDLPGVPFDLSPWLDMRFSDATRLNDLFDAQQHRHIIKTHSPADAIPLDDDCRYIAVFRDPRDVVMSWANHRTSMAPEVIEGLNALAAADGVAPLDPVWNGDLDVLIGELDHEFDLAGHLASWWPLRDDPNVLILHYEDLLADCGTVMRRIASFLDIEIGDDRWDAVVERCGLERMREHGRESETMAAAFRGGADSFFHQGTNDRWRGALTDDQLARLDALTADLPADARDWLVRRA